MRIDPPMSVPIPTVAIPAQTAAALPPLEPPGVMPARQGLFVAGKKALVVPPPAARSRQFGLPPPPAPRELRPPPRSPHFWEHTAPPTPQPSTPRQPPASGRVLAEVQVEHVVEGAAQKEADDESDVAEGGIGVWYRTDVQAEAVGEEIDGDHQPDAHGHDSLPAVVPGVVEHAFVTVVTTAQPVVHEHHREPSSDPVADQEHKALVPAS